jgi:hypothetical protein
MIFFQAIGQSQTDRGNFAFAHISGFDRFSYRLLVNLSFLFRMLKPHGSTPSHLPTRKTLQSQQNQLSST